MKKHTRQLVASIVLFIIGVIFAGLSVYQNRQYEKYALTVIATITDIKKSETVIDTDSMSRGYIYKYYGEYVVDDKLYTNKYLGDWETYGESPYSVGDSKFIEVNSSDPSKSILNGGFYMIVSSGMFIVSTLIDVVRRRS